ncbi:hypothetical protein JMUB6875_48890 [Nocardia sp. JMUB6875]|uniref:hypothetical protein n=1 Tax=Nocardia sp. JMUB6875 TaxID=3158170 RepID=UPI0032E7BB35
MDGVLTFDHELTIHLDPGTYHWISVKVFRFESAQPNHEQLLSALIAHPRYRDHYATDFAEQGTHALHGPYRLDAITADTFTPTTAEAARTLLQDWANTASGSVPVKVQRELDERVFAWLGLGVLYRLPDLRPGAEHDWGWVVGAINGFHELVSIDHKNRILTLVVAADD